MRLPCCSDRADAGVQVCKDDGSGFGACACGDGDGTGNSCTDPVIVSSLPFEHSAETSGSENSFAFPVDGCSGYNFDTGAASDHVFAFSPPQTGFYGVSVAPFAWDASVFFMNACIDSGACVAASDAYDAGVTEVSFAYLEAGIEIFVVVEGNSVDDHGSYSLELTGRSASCEDPLLLPMWPYTDHGDTSTAMNRVRGTSGCEGMGEGEPDVVYGLNFVGSGQFSITVTPEGNADLALMLTESCSETIECVASADVGGAAESERLTVTLNSDTDYFLVVSGGVNGEPGAYSLEVNSE